MMISYKTKHKFGISLVTAASIHFSRFQANGCQLKCTYLVFQILCGFRKKR